MTIKFTLVLLAAALLGACSEETKTEPAAEVGHTEHAHEGQHGGELIEIGDHVAHLEVLHDESAGKVTVYVLGPDAETALPVAKAPQLKLSTDAGQRVLAMQPQDGSSSVFSVTDDTLKGHAPEGRISIEIDGKVYNPDFVHDHH